MVNMPRMNRIVSIGDVVSVAYFAIFGSELPYVAIASRAANLSNCIRIILTSMLRKIRPFYEAKLRGWGDPIDAGARRVDARGALALSTRYTVDTLW
jgi:hypothetical protein